MSRYAMIMAGGAGTRLWPMSRKDRPKQLIRFIQPAASEGKPESKADSKAKGKAEAKSEAKAEASPEQQSLLELAATRLEGLIDRKHRYICTSESYREIIRAEIEDFSDKAGNERILGEPCGRDTVNAVGLTAAVLHKIDKKAVFAVLTADHIIEPQDVFRERMDLGFRLIEDDADRLVTFSIKPTSPATGFGYVERGTPIRGVKGSEIKGQHLAFHVERFVEKPDLPRAQAYVQSGQFGWNSGMFVWKAETFLRALEKFKPENHEMLMKVAAAWGTKKQKATLEDIYPKLPKISVDYAIMEPAAKDKEREFTICTVLMDLKWLDVGSWPSYAETVVADAKGMRVSGAGATVAVKCKNTLSVNAVAGHTVALLGCEDLIVVHTKDATLVMPRARAEELKELHGEVAEGLR